VTLNSTLDSDTASEIATLENVPQTWLPSSHGGHHQATYSISPANNSVQNLDQNATIKLENSNSPNNHLHHNHNNHHQSSASVSPASFAEEVTLPFTCVTVPGSTHSSGKSIINSMTSLFAHTVAQPTKMEIFAQEFEPASYFFDWNCVHLIMTLFQKTNYFKKNEVIKK
jgi:hypothetical protein